MNTDLSAKCATASEGESASEGGLLEMTVCSKSIPFSIGGGTGESISIRDDIIEELENVYLERRMEVVLPDGFLRTPLRVLKLLAEEFKDKVHSEVIVVNHLGNEAFRVELFVGHIQGVGQSHKRKLSFQMAAIDVLEKIRASNNSIKLRPYALLPGCRIDPKIYSDLNQACFQRALRGLRFVKLEPGLYEEGPMYTVKCCLGDLTVIEKSDEPHMAKRLAAKKMYEEITGVHYPDMEALLGNQCLSMKSSTPHRIKVLPSAWKKAWNNEYKREGDVAICPEDEPADSDFDLGYPEDNIEELAAVVVLPRNGEMTGLTRIRDSQQSLGQSGAASGDVLQFGNKKIVNSSDRKRKREGMQSFQTDSVSGGELKNHFEDDIADWFMTTTDGEARRQVLRRIFNVLPEEDFKKCFSIISKCRKYRKRESAAEEIQNAGGSRSAQVKLSVPLPLANSGWLRKFSRKDVVAMDVEKVMVPLDLPTKKRKFEQKAAIISVVNSEGDEIFKAKIRREFGSYEVNKRTVALNGITEKTLQDDDAENMISAYDRLRKVLDGKLVVGLALEQDFACMEDIAAGTYNTFDLQTHFYRLIESHGIKKRIEEKLGLRSLCRHYFGIDMQPPHQIHTPDVDAKYTMRLFLEIYCKINPPPEFKDGNIYGTNEICHFK